MSIANIEAVAQTSTDTSPQSVLQVTVKVNPEGQIFCQPAEAIVTGKDVLIVFDLRGEHWAFPACDAVVVSDGGEEFPIPAWTVNPKQAALLDCNSASAAFGYTVTVLNTRTGERRSLDPRIVNES
jgi:hypothetical protein